MLSIRIASKADSTVGSGRDSLEALGRMSCELQRLRSAATAISPIRSAIQACRPTTPGAQNAAAVRRRTGNLIVPIIPHLPPTIRSDEFLAGRLENRRQFNRVGERPPGEGVREDVLQTGEHRQLAPTHGLLGGRHEARARMIAKFPNKLSDEDSVGHAASRRYGAHLRGDAAADRGECRGCDLRIGAGVDYLPEVDHVSSLSNGPSSAFARVEKRRNPRECPFRSVSQGRRQ